MGSEMCIRDSNILDVYPWLQSYLGAYMLGGAGSFQMRVVRG